jgi:hypothetical protein
MYLIQIGIEFPALLINLSKLESEINNLKLMHWYFSLAIRLPETQLTEQINFAAHSSTI